MNIFEDDKIKMMKPEKTVDFSVMYCGCGRRTRYVKVINGKEEHACNKYGRCPEKKNGFEAAFDIIQKEVHQIAIEHGWWEEDRSDGECIALMHSELSEALEGLREGDPLSNKVPKFTKSESELADVIIRIMDYAAARKLDVSGALLAKVEYNRTRPYKHGGKKF